MRDRMISMILENIRDIVKVNMDSRYRSVFYYLDPSLSESATKKFMKRVLEGNLVNIETLHDLNDDELFDTFVRFMRRYNTWM